MIIPESRASRSVHPTRGLIPDDALDAVILSGEICFYSCTRTKNAPVSLLRRLCLTFLLVDGTDWVIKRVLLSIEILEKQTHTHTEFVFPTMLLLRNGGKISDIHHESIGILDAAAKQTS